MANQGDVSLALSSSLSTSFHNWRQGRSYTPTLTKRSEGWTERWGHTSDDVADADCWTLEQDSAQHIFATAYPVVPITLFQYRPAWREQLALTVCNLPYTVVNTTHAVTEATGQLPALRELQPNLPPVLTGRTHVDGTPGNAIMDYLAKERGIDLDTHLRGSKELLADSKLYTNLIQKTLEPALCALRYQDWEAWGQVYRPQCLHASTGISECSFWSRLPGWWQAWSERIHNKSTLSLEMRSLNSEQVVQQVLEAYKVLEEQLQSQQATVKGDSYLLGTPKPQKVDLLLWDHLMQALTDVHLIVILADFPALCRYVQRIWDRYFTCPTAIKVAEWQTWNAQENARNAFSQLPMLPKDVSEENPSFRNAVQLMEQLSVQTHDLHESLTLAKGVRSTKDEMRPKYRPFHTWHRWRMGDQMHPVREKPQERGDATAARDEEMKKEFKRNDEVWMTGVAAVSVAAAASFLFATTQA